MKIILFIIGAAFILFISYLAIMANRLRKTKYENDSEKIIVLNDKTFANQIKSGITFVDFWAPWCMPCKMMIPILNELAENQEHNASIAKLNIDENQQTAAKYGVRSIPTSIVFKNGKEVQRFVGVKPSSYFIKQLKNI